MPITDLPEDIIHLILPFLSAKDFLSFTSTNKAFYDTFQLDRGYWRTQISSTFRLPISPLLYQEGGARWYRLYKKLRTETTAYAWGPDSDGALGLVENDPPDVQPPSRERNLFGFRLPLPAHGPRPHRLPRISRPHTYPEQMYIPEKIGTIADLQCGGWSTSILTAKGEVWAVGTIDAADGSRYGQSTQVLTKLQWGADPSEKQPWIPKTVPIKQFSSGRRHLMGLDDEGNLWYWDLIEQPAKLLKLTIPELVDSLKPTKVIAGWQTSSAFIPGKGIVYWTPPWRTNQVPSPTIHEKIVPDTGFSLSQQVAGTDEADSVGGVLGYVVLENYIVYITSTSKVFAFKHDEDHQQPFQLTSLVNSGSKLLDIQGSFRNFAIFSSTGEVVTCHQTYLDRWNAALLRVRDLMSIQGVPSAVLDSSRPNIERPPLIPALQHTSVISLAFGDYHFHALHANGTVSSYGVEPQTCGAFGLGTHNAVNSLLRGLDPPVPPRWGNPDTRLIEQGWRSPRAIWFDKERHEWIQKVARQAQDRGWNQDVNQGGLDEEGWAGVSEWVEQESRAWHQRERIIPQSHLRQNEDETEVHGMNYNNPEQAELSPYFAVAVSAAGWHSGALVLVDPNPDHDQARGPEPKNPLAQEKQEPLSANQKGESSTIPRSHHAPNLPSKLRLPSGRMLQAPPQPPPGDADTTNADNQAAAAASSSSTTAADAPAPGTTGSEPETEEEEAQWRFGMPARLYTSADAPPERRAERG